MSLCRNCHGTGHLYKHPMTWRRCNTCDTRGVTNAGYWRWIGRALIGPGVRSLHRPSKDLYI